MEKAADETGATTASERRYSDDVTSLGASVALQRHMEEATPTHKQGRGEPGPNASQRRLKKSEPTTRAAKQVMLHLQDKAYK
jgi:hypothetical protein